MATNHQLLGPPSLDRPFSLIKGGRKYYHRHTLTHSKQQPPPSPQAPTLTPLQNPCLDLFFANPKLPISLFEKAWNHDPLTTLKLLFIHQNVAGKNSEKDSFFASLLWLHKTHPRTLACNVKVLANVGSLKDVIEILHRILFDDQSLPSHRIKKERNLAMARRVIERFKSDKDYRFLHKRISGLFADQLKSDVQFLALGETGKISLASKCCPSLDSSYDKSTLICEAIGTLLFPLELYDEYSAMEEAHYVFRVRDRLRKEVLIPLRKALTGVDFEEKLGEKRGLCEGKIFRVYQKIYDKFVLAKDDDEKFRLYLDIVNSLDERKVSSNFTNNIVDFVKNGIMEFQWHKLAQVLSKKEEWCNCVAICNISENTRGTVIRDFAISMGQLLSELNQEEPWKGRAFACGDDPKLVKIEGSNFQSKLWVMRKLESEGRIRFSKVFDEILDIALAEKVPADKMVKRIFAFSGIGFDVAANNFWGVWATDAKYRNHGYNVLPEVVFWDLSDDVTRPVTRKGLRMLKGLSNSFVSVLLNRGETMLGNGGESLVFTKPRDVMKLAISGEELKSLCS